MLTLSQEDKVGLGIPWRCVNPSVLIRVHCMDL